MYSLVPGKGQHCEYSDNLVSYLLVNVYLFFCKPCVGSQQSKHNLNVLHRGGLAVSLDRTWIAHGADQRAHFCENAAVCRVRRCYPNARGCAKSDGVSDFKNWSQFLWNRNLFWSEACSGLREVLLCFSAPWLEEAGRGRWFRSTCFLRVPCSSRGDGMPPRQVGGATRPSVNNGSICNDMLQMWFFFACVCQLHQVSFSCPPFTREEQRGGIVCWEELQIGLKINVRPNNSLFLLYLPG